MSVIYKALRTIESAEGAPHPRAGATSSIDKGSLSRRGGTKAFAVLGMTAGVCVIALALIGLQRPASWGTEIIDKFRGFSIGEPALNAGSSQERESTATPRLHERGLTGSASPVKASVAAVGVETVPNTAPSPRSAEFVFEPPKAGPAGASSVSVDASRHVGDRPLTAGYQAGPSAGEVGRQSPINSPAHVRVSGAGLAQSAASTAPFGVSPDSVEKIGRAAAPPGRTDNARSLKAATLTSFSSSPARGSADSDADVEDHTRRVRVLNANLSRAIKQRDLDEVAEIVESMQNILGADSVYMLKIRAFAQIATGGDNENAMRILREVLARDPGDKEAALNMAVAQINLGETDEARQGLELLAAAHPGEAAISSLLRSLQ